MQALVPAPGQPDYARCLEAFPVLEQAKATPQEPRYHGEGDVWTHTCMVVDALLQSADYLAATPDERGVLFFAALLHDVAKHRTTVVDPMTGRIGQPGHSRKGAVDVRILLWEAGPSPLRAGRVPADRGASGAVLLSGGRAPSGVAGLDGARAVVAAGHPPACGAGRGRHARRICADQARVLDSIELFRELAREEGCWARAPGLRRRAHAAEAISVAPTCIRTIRCSSARLEGDADVRPAGIG